MKHVYRLTDIIMWITMWKAVCEIETGKKPSTSEASKAFRRQGFTTSVVGERFIEDHSSG